MSLTRRSFASLALAAAAAPVFTGAARAQAGRIMVAGPLGDRVEGDLSAPVTIVEYASMTCGHCANFHTQVHGPLKENYLETGKAALVFREFPLDPLAMAASMMAHCAGGYEPGMEFAALADMSADEKAAADARYFAVVGALFERQRAWAFTERPLDALRDMGRQIGLSEEAFNACLRDQALLDAINAVKTRGEELGVSSTPTFFINGEEVRGARSYEEMSAIIDAAA